MDDVPNILERMESYTADHCWQYDIKLSNMYEDMQLAGITEQERRAMRCPDFTFTHVASRTSGASEVAAFIRRHEWLGTMSQFPTHYFAAHYKGILAGALVLNMPNAFSKLLGDDTKALERLVSRGACISWAPKNLASKFLMHVINYMVRTTQYRLFTAYSDPTAKELGTIYQACNWSYLGQKSGTTRRYINPFNGKLMSDRAFRARSFYKRYAVELGIDWQREWNTDHRIHWHLMPDGVEDKLRAMSRAKQAAAKFFTFPPKHKYAYVQGRTQGETRYLRKKLAELNKLYPYPRVRGVSIE